MFSERLAELVFQTVETLPSVVILQIVSELENLSERLDDKNAAEIFVSQSLAKISERFPNPAARYAVEKLFDGWQEEKKTNPVLTVREIASALRILDFNRRKTKDRQRIELVWTGPASRIPVRQTRQVLSQLINNAQKELLIVSFVVFKIPEILELLKNALQRGVKITCILESPEESDGKIIFQGFADFEVEILRQIKILVWSKDMRPINADGKIGTLHAKVAVADQNISFISSANLTLNAMTLNMELGLLLHDDTTAREIVKHFEQLVQNEILKHR